jgi:hypothetical protein
MKQLFIPLCLAIIFTSSFNAPFSSIQKLTLSVYKGNTKIGVIHTGKQSVNNKTTYYLLSVVKMECIIKQEIKEDITDVFEQGILIRSTQQRFINGDLKLKNTLLKNGNVYELNNAEKATNELVPNIDASVLSIYFAEPKSKQKIYSQNFGTMLPIEETSPNSYTLHLPNKKNTAFHYKNGMLQNILANTPIGTIQFIVDEDNN